MSEILNKLNEEQLKPASTTEGPVLVTAGAGSGKTRLLTHRIAHLVKDKEISKSNILAITFTNKAAQEMKERLGKLISGADDMWICTFHAMCSKILRRHAKRVGLDSNFSIYGDQEKTRLIKRLLSEDAEFLALDKNKLKVETVAFHISNAKNELYSYEKYAEIISEEKYASIIIKCYKNYQKELLLANAVDFDDMLVKVYELFDLNEDVLNFYQDKFMYIHVDEFQDTNVVQYKLVEMLGKKHNNIFVVGDEDQCIYSWRGAKFSNVQKFIDDYKKDINIFKLEQNYRSTEKILEVANGIIKNNTNRLDKNLWTENKGGREVSFVNYYNDLEEAEMIATKIKKLVMEEDYKYSDFAVLMRINALSRVLEEKFLNYQIPYEVYGGFKFFERKEVKDVLAYLKVISNPKDGDSLARVLAFPKKGIGETSISKLLSTATTLNMSAYDVAKTGLDLDNSLIKKLTPTITTLDTIIKEKANLSISALITKVLDTFEIKNAFSKNVEEDVSRLMNIDTLAKSIIEYEEANENATLEDYLQSITLSRDIDEYDENDNYVSLMTIHSAKGLEFKVVFVIGLVDGILPLSRAINSFDPNELEEERRLMYVAVTRAKSELYLTRPTTRFSFETKRTEATVLSRFVKEAGMYKEKEEAIKSSIKDSYYASSYSGYNSSFRQEKQTKSFGYASSLDDDYVVESTPVTKLSKEKINEYSAYKVGTKVMHKSFGKGIVTVPATDMQSAFITIRFETVGVKTLSLKFAPLTILES